MQTEEALKKRLRSLIELYIKDEYPINLMILGFGMLKVDSRKKLKGRIDELAQLLGLEVDIEKIKEVKL